MRGVETHFIFSGVEQCKGKFARNFDPPPNVAEEIADAVPVAACNSPRVPLPVPATPLATRPGRYPSL